MDNASCRRAKELRDHSDGIQRSLEGDSGVSQVLNKLSLIIGITFSYCAFIGVATSTVVAQCQSGGCDGGYAGSSSDGGVFESNVESGQPYDFPSCADGSCQRPPTCPSSYCGPYISVFGGWTTIDRFRTLGIVTEQVTTTIVPPVNPGDDATRIYEYDGTQLERSFQTDDGGAGGFALGRQVHPQARMELEFGYRQNDFDSFRVEEYTDSFITTDIAENDPVFDNLALTDVNTVAAVGEMRSYSIMGNFLYDFSPRFVRRYNLYGGGGIGILNVSGTPTTATDVYDVNDTTFAYQIIFGVNRSVTQRIDMFLDYRFLSASSISVTDASNGASLGSFELNSNNLFFGMRFRK